MNPILVFLLVLAVILLVTATGVWQIVRLHRVLWVRSRPEQLLKRTMILSSAVVIAASPFAANYFWMRNAVLSRVPAPLEVAEIEYQLEQSWGIGGPGDNETGLVIYRLTDASADWARSRGSILDEALSSDRGAWQPTPVDDKSKPSDWHPYDDELPDLMAPHPPELHEYLEKYGFTIDIEEGRELEVNHAIQTSGSFYAKGKGGSVTVVDSERGKVYFFYAG
ncbi:MAG: hypothetical protein JWR75_1848 [Devosia sp.]|nr:hypothetical protein [Devosia sp.]